MRVPTEEQVYQFLARLPSPRPPVTALMSQRRRDAPRNAVTNVQMIPPPSSPNRPRMAPPITPPTIPTTMFPTMPNLSPWINRSASAPARPPTTIQTIHAQSVPRTLAITSDRTILLLLLGICTLLDASRNALMQVDRS